MGEPEGGEARPTNVTETLMAADAIMPTAFLAPSTRVGWSADTAVTELYSLHYRPLVRLAALLVRDMPTAEEVVQDAFVAMHDAWQRLRESENALAYLRQAVVNRSRSVLRHRTVVDKNLLKAPPDMPSAEHGAMALLERSAVIAALRGLPDRQREAHRAAVLRRPIRGGYRGHHGHQPGRSEKSYGAGHDGSSLSIGAGVMSRPGHGPPRAGRLRGLRPPCVACCRRPGGAAWDGLERIREKIRSRPASRQPARMAAIRLAIAGFFAQLAGSFRHGVVRPHRGAGPAALGRPAAARAAAAQELERGHAPARPGLGITVFAVGVVLAAVPPLPSGTDPVRPVGLQRHEHPSASPSGSPGGRLGNGRRERDRRGRRGYRPRLPRHAHRRRLRRPRQRLKPRRSAPVADPDDDQPVDPVRPRPRPLPAASPTDSPSQSVTRADSGTGTAKATPHGQSTTSSSPKAKPKPSGTAGGCASPSPTKAPNATPTSSATRSRRSPPPRRARHRRRP